MTDPLTKISPAMEAAILNPFLRSSIIPSNPPVGVLPPPGGAFTLPIRSVEEEPVLGWQGCFGHRPCLSLGRPGPVSLEVFRR